MLVLHFPYFTTLQHYAIHVAWDREHVSGYYTCMSASGNVYHLKCSFEITFDCIIFDTGHVPGSRLLDVHGLNMELLLIM